MLLVKVFALVIWFCIITDNGLNTFLQYRLIRKRKKLKRKVLKYLQDEQEIDITLIEKQQPCKHQS